MISFAFPNWLARILSGDTPEEVSAKISRELLEEDVRGLAVRIYDQDLPDGKTAKDLLVRLGAVKTAQKGPKEAVTRAQLSAWAAGNRGLGELKQHFASLLESLKKAKKKDVVELRRQFNDVFRIADYFQQH